MRFGFFPIIPAVLSGWSICAASSCLQESSVSSRQAVLCGPKPDRPAALTAAGSGSNLPLVREISKKYEEQRPGKRIFFPESIGTSGAVKALLDGAIDIGLASRHLKDVEKRQGLVETPLTRIPLAVVVHAGTKASSVSRGELAEIYSGRLTAWPDGSPVVPLMREAGDSSLRLLADRFPELGAFFDEAIRSDRWLVCYTDQEMRDALLAVPGTVGFLDTGTITLERLPLVPLPFDGVEPTAENAAAGRYPLVKPLSFITRGAPAGEAADFVAFARSEEVSSIFTAGGYMPPEDMEH